MEEQKAISTIEQYAEYQILFNIVMFKIEQEIAKTRSTEEFLNKTILPKTWK